MRWILGIVAVRSAAVWLRLCCKTTAEVIVSPKGFACRIEWPASQRQPSCSQPQPISITCDLSASLQYSPQYLLPCSAGQSHGPCLHLFETSSAMIRLLVDRTISFGGINYGYARRDQLDRQATSMLISEKGLTERNSLRYEVVDYDAAYLNCLAHQARRRKTGLQGRVDCHFAKTFGTSDLLRAYDLPILINHDSHPDHAFIMVLARSVGIFRYFQMSGLAIEDTAGNWSKFFRPRFRR